MFGGSKVKADVFTGAFDWKAAEDIDSLLSLSPRVNADERRINEQHRSSGEQHHDGRLDIWEIRKLVFGNFIARSFLIKASVLTVSVLILILSL